MKKEYKFQALLKKVPGTDKVTGYMGPIMAIRQFCAYTKITINGACRVHNNQSSDATYDHIVLRQEYKNGKLYHMFVDMGDEFMAVALWFDEEPVKELLFAPIYKKEITLKSMIKHLTGMEKTVRVGATLESIDHPIMILTKSMMHDIFVQAEASGCLDPVTIKEKEEQQ